MLSEDIHWYKDAIIYELHVRCFFDSDSDGIGDFLGLTEKLDYIQDLGVNAIWLLPFYPSPLKDDGYDIADYLDIHPHYGKLNHFKLFLREAHQRGLKVITELVVNHTSDQHPWFQRARHAKKNSRYRNFYVWSDDPNRYKDARIIFQDFEKSNWSWDSVAESYYWHRFYYHQPDLNFGNPEVADSIFKILSFWLKLGVDGVRLDAVPYLFEREGTNCENLPETHEFLKNLRGKVDSHFEKRMFLAEANQWPEDAAKYFGEGDECHMAFHFPAMPRLFMAIHLEDSLPIIEIFGQTPAIPDSCQWALFLRNHDELTLEMVTDEERDYMFRVYANDPQARINLGIRRRLAPLLKNDRRRIELMNSLLFSLTGTPVLYYGDEIGMGDNIYLGDRNGVRTPMQWSSDRNAGFSRANPQQLYLPIVTDPEYHFATVNVEAQQNNPNSLLWWTKQLIALRKRFKAFGHGTTQFIKPENRKVLVFIREYQSDLILIISNLSRFSQYVELDLSKYNEFYPFELFSGERFPKIGELPYFLTLGPYGYYWFVLKKEEALSPLQLSEFEKEKKITTIVLKKNGDSIFAPSMRQTLELILRNYFVKRVWFQKSINTVDRTKSKILDRIVIPSKDMGKIHLIIVQLVFTNGIIENYPFYLSVLHGEHVQKKIQENPERVLAKFHLPKGSESILYDIGEEPGLSRMLLDLVVHRRKIKGELLGELHGISQTTLREKSTFIEMRKKETIREDEKSIYIPLEYGILKIARRTDESLSIDVEMRAFLNARTTFRNFLPLYGYLKYRGANKCEISLVEEIASYPQEFNAKSLAVEEAIHFLMKLVTGRKSFDEKVLIPEATVFGLTHLQFDAEFRVFFQGYPEIASQLGETAADLHNALASTSELTEFSPVSFTLFYQRSLYQSLRRKFTEGFSVLHYLLPHVSENLAEAIDEFLKHESELMTYLYQLTQMKIQGNRLRYHGAFSLENLLYTGKEFLIPDFAGNPSQSYIERKYKRCPLIDVVNMIISFAEAGDEAAKRIQTQGLANVPPSTLSHWSLSWALWIGVSFLRSYFKKISGNNFLPSSEKELDFIMSVLLFEKCFEKIVEEGRHHPEKIEIPFLLMKHWVMIYEKKSKGAS